MKELLQTIFKSTEERLKNPFIGAFLSSWVLFNWKPIFFILFSNKNIEDKILVISSTYSDLWNLLYLPLLSTVFYILFLPYINLLIDFLLNRANLYRNKQLIAGQMLIIANKRELAIEEIKLEEAKTDFRERNTHNKLVEELQGKVIQLEERLSTVNSESSALLDTINAENLKTHTINKKRIQEQLLELEKVKDELQHVENQRLLDATNYEREISALRETVTAQKTLSERLVKAFNNEPPNKKAPLKIDVNKKS